MANFHIRKLSGLLNDNMDYMVASQNKRRLEVDMENCHYFNPSKKLCNGLGVCNQFHHSGPVSFPMNTQEMENVHKDNLSSSSHDTSTVYVARSNGSGQCPRCIAGEPGHINHIMGYN
ncbi:hypothetical protein GN956_G12192 [Arapaima gigas]